LERRRFHRSLTKIFNFFLLVTSITFPLLFPSFAHGAQLSIAWNPNPEPDLGGYMVYFGTASRSYGSSVDVGKVTSYVLTGLAPGQKYFIALTAYDTSDNESGFSNEVSATTQAAETVSTPSVLTGPTSGTTGVAYSFTTGGSSSSLGHSIQYQFDWKGDGSVLSSWGSATQSRTWTAGATYNVRTRARCTSHTTIISNWSNSLFVTVTGPAPPTVTSFAIDGGASSTGMRAVSLNNSASTKPTHHMASESPSFVGARWTFYSVQPKITLSPGSGTKTVYFKVKNNLGESPAVSDTITLVGPAVTSFQINNGASSTTSKAVTLNNTTSIKPTQYMASELSSFVGAKWTYYSVQPKFTLSAGAGTKTVYFKVKNSVGESGVASDTITLQGPSVTSFQINSGAATTASSSVILNNSASNTPTQFMASESPSFAGATWTYYSVQPKFTINSGVGTRTIYFKVKNSVGESPIVSDTITLQ
jgi:cytochrome c oxidase assembly protein Cox11